MKNAVSNSYAITAITAAIAAVISLAAVLLVAPTIAMAQNPHFIGQLAGRESDGVLIVPFTIAGFGNEPVRVTLEGTASTEILCFPPPEQKKKEADIGVPVETQKKKVESSHLLSEPILGQITSTLTLQIGPQEISDDACQDPQWEPRFGQVKFQGATLTVEQPPGSIALSAPVTLR